MVPITVPCTCGTVRRMHAVNTKWEMADYFNDAVEFAAQKLGLPKLKSQQTNALRQFVQGHDLFVHVHFSYNTMEKLSTKHKPGAKSKIIIKYKI